MPLAFLEGLFIARALDEPVFFFSVVLTVVVSVTLHELGHAWVAIWQGDPTPRQLGHLTLDPLKHMGPVSLVVLFLVGIAWGATPVDPSRFRSRFGDAIVAAAGPMVNLLLAFLGLTALGIWVRAGGMSGSDAVHNFREFLFIFGWINVVLFLLNLIPVPPLDGSRVVANFVPPFARAIRDPNNQGVFFAVFILIFIGADKLFALARHIAENWLLLFLQ
jgi:Zn-dependent protease